MKENNAITRIRFKDDNGKDFPEWEEKKLGELGKFIGGGTPATNNADFWDGNIPWVSSSDITDKSIYQINATRFITPEAVLQSATKLIPKGSILIVSRVGVGKVAVNEVDLCTSQDFTNLILNTDNYKFLAYLIKYKTNKLLEFNQGTSIKGFVKSDLETLEIKLPSLEEQAKIANFLSAIDEKIENLEKELDELKAYKKGVMQAIFNEDDQTQIGGGGKSLVFSYLETIRFKDDNGNDFPSWQVKKLGEIGEFKNGINKSSEDFGFGFPFINLMDVFGKATISNLKLDLVNANEKELRLYELKKGDVLFIRSSVKKSGVGETSLVMEDLNETVFSGFLIRFRDTKMKFDLGFKKYCFAERKFRESLIAVSTTSANTNINQESLSELKISIPTMNEQTKIANFLSAIDERIDHCSNQIGETVQYKKGLLQQLFV